MQGTNPFTTLRNRKEEGLKLIVIDPRRTELATQADIHLQIRPGEDPTLLATFINIILSEDLYDHEFCEEWIEATHLESLADATKNFTADFAADRCGVRKEDILKAAKLFAEGPTGTAGTGTGPSMSPYPSLMEHLVICLNVICGRWLRAGQIAESRSLLQPNTPKRAQVLGPFNPLSGPKVDFGDYEGMAEKCLVRHWLKK